MTWEEREVCAEPYGGVSLAEGTVIAIKQQTADARPTHTNLISTLQQSGRARQ
jgi:hypothetical protein